MALTFQKNFTEKRRPFADAQHISVDEVIVSAVNEKLAEWERLKQRAARGCREEFFKVLEKVPDVEPEKYDSF